MGKVNSWVSGYKFMKIFPIIEQISENIPSVNIRYENLNIPKNIRLADISIGEIGKIDT